MANNQFMALFGPDSVVASTLSETNSVKYKLCVRGSNSDSRITDVEVSINDVDIIDRTTQKGRGLNLAVIDATTSTLIEWKYFDVYASNRDSVITAMQDYITSLPINRIVAIYTYDALQSTTTLDNFMRGYMGSTAWAGSEVINKPSVTNITNPSRCSYSAIYNSKLRKIVSENFVGNSFSSLLEDSRSFVEIVYDDLDDIGATGIPQRIIDEPLERTGDGSNYRVYTWPNPLAIGTDLFIGDLISITADLFQDQTLINAGGYAVFSIYSQNSSGVIIDEKRIDSRTTVGQYKTVSDYYTIPAGSVTIGCTYYHFPSTVKTGTSKIKNVVVTKVSRMPKETGTAAIGVNGIRLTTMAERDETGTDNPIDKLLVMSVGQAGTSPSKFMKSSNFAEMETLFADSATVELGSSASVSLVKTWVSTVELSSFSVNPGDSIIISAEMSRDATAIANGKYAQITARFFDASGQVLTEDGPKGITTIPTVYNFFKSEIVIPANADKVTFRLLRAPDNVSTTGNMWVRNVLFRVNRGA